MSNPYQILLFKGGDPIASVVKWQTRSKYSHAAIRLACSNMVIESYPFKGVRVRDLTEAELEKVDAYTVAGIMDEQWQAAIDFAKSEVGAGYDWRMVFRFVTRVNGASNKRWFCSELVYEALRSAGIHLLRDVEGWQVSPGMLGYSGLLYPSEV